MKALRKAPFMKVADRLTDVRFEGQSRHSRWRAAAAGLSSPILRFFRNAPFYISVNQPRRTGSPAFAGDDKCGVRGDAAPSLTAPASSVVAAGGRRRAHR